MTVRSLPDPDPSDEVASADPAGVQQLGASAPTVAGPARTEPVQPGVPQPEAAPPEAAPERPEPEKRRKKKGSLLRELPVLIVVAILIAIFVKAFFLQAFWIPSGSMEPTLDIQDRVLVNKVAYLFHGPRRGDIIVFRSPSQVGTDVPSRSFWEEIGQRLGDGVRFWSTRTKDLIKRVVGLPGETVWIHDGGVYINGRRLAESYLPRGMTTGDFGPVRVPAGHYFVMGDNRNNSSDARVFGAIDKDSIIGKAFIRVWPVNRFGSLGPSR